MAAADGPAAAGPKAPRGRGGGARVNLSDVPEMMPGAQPGANPAQRFDFEQRCRRLHQDAVQEETDWAAAEGTARAADAASSASTLESMFPLLDPALVRSLVAEARTQQDAVEMLLVLSASMGGEEDPATRAATPPPRSLGVEDREKFPSLGGPPVEHPEEVGDDKDLGSAWRDRAKAAAALPGPPRAPWVDAAAPRRRRVAASKEDIVEVHEPMTDYEFRQRAGQRRARHRAMYGRGSGRGGTQAARRRAAGGGEASGSEASEEEDEAGGGADGGRGAAGERTCVAEDLGEDEEPSRASRAGPPLIHRAR